MWKVRSPTVSCGCLEEVEEEETMDFSIFTYRLWYLFVWKWRSLSRVRLFASLWTIYSTWNFSGQNTRVGSLSLLQGRTSQPRDRTQVSSIAGEFFASWATREKWKWSRSVVSTLTDPGIEPRSPALQADDVTVWATREAPQAHLFVQASL